jgi:hypothetical protein
MFYEQETSKIWKKMFMLLSKHKSDFFFLYYLHSIVWIITPPFVLLLLYTWQIIMAQVSKIINQVQIILYIGTAHIMHI